MHRHAIGLKYRSLLAQAVASARARFLQTYSIRSADR